MTNTSEDRITEIFNDLSGGDVERVKKNKDYAFVHFNTREGAERVLNTNNLTLFCLVIYSLICL